MARRSQATPGLFGGSRDGARTYHQIGCAVSCSTSYDVVVMKVESMNHDSEASQSVPQSGWGMNQSLWCTILRAERLLRRHLEVLIGARRQVVVEDRAVAVLEQILPQGVGGRLTELGRPIQSKSLMVALARYHSPAWSTLLLLTSTKAIPWRKTSLAKDCRRSNASVDRANLWKFSVSRSRSRRAVFVDIMVVFSPRCGSRVESFSSVRFTVGRT